MECISRTDPIGIIRLAQSVVSPPLLTSRNSGNTGASECIQVTTNIQFWRNFKKIRFLTILFPVAQSLITRGCSGTPLLSLAVEPQRTTERVCVGGPSGAACRRRRAFTSVPVVKAYDSVLSSTFVFFLPHLC